MAISYHPLLWSFGEKIGLWHIAREKCICGLTEDPSSTVSINDMSEGTQGVPPPLNLYNPTEIINRIEATPYKVSSYYGYNHLATAPSGSATPAVTTVSFNYDYVDEIKTSYFGEYWESCRQQSPNMTNQEAQNPTIMIDRFYGGNPYADRYMIKRSLMMLNLTSTTPSSIYSYFSNGFALTDVAIRLTGVNLSLASRYISENFPALILKYIFNEDESGVNRYLNTDANFPARYHFLAYDSVTKEMTGTYTCEYTYHLNGDCLSAMTESIINNNPAYFSFAIEMYTDNILEWLADASIADFLESAEFSGYQIAITLTQQLATVTTSSESNITYNGATLGGNISDEGGSSVTDRGIVWSTTDSTPTIHEGATKVSIGSGTGSFSQAITGMPDDTLIYFRAFGTNQGGSGYGAVDTFTTAHANEPTVTTANASSVGPTSAVLGGDVTSAGDATVSERGVVYSSSNTTPILGGSGCTTDTNGSGTGTFNETISGLTTNITYYFRAYAVNVHGVGYGTVKSFTTNSY